VESGLDPADDPRCVAVSVHGASVYGSPVILEAGLLRLEGRGDAVNLTSFGFVTGWSTCT
jgi:hypothetical protein